VITRITGQMYRKGLTALERGDIEQVLRQFDSGCTLTFVGDTPLGVQASSGADIRRWFERFGRLLPHPRFEVQRLLVGGPPWNQRLAAHVLIRSTIDGEPYENQFAHFLTLRWGKVREDLILEDTQTWERACRRLATAGVSEAAAGRLAAGAA
jgi:ketosteroid isomerase-like protein